MNDEVKKAWNLFLEHVQKSSEVQKLMKAVGSGTATYAEALEYSSLLSKLLVESASEVYPNDSQKVLGMLKNTQYCRNYFRHVDKYLYDLQSSLNKGSGLGMKPVKMIKYNQLLDQSVSSSDDYKADIEKYKSKAELSANKHVDTYQQYNAKTQTKAGYKVTVSRTYDGVGLSDKRVCTWCLERAKSNVPYDEAFKNGMFQRHEGCHCIIEYNNNGEKSYQVAKGGENDWIKEKEIRKRKSILEKNSNKSYNYEEYKGYEFLIKSGEITPLADFKLYHTVRNVIKKKLVGKTTTNGIKITDVSNHFVARVIGSTEQRRDGVTISNIYKTVTTSKDIGDVKEGPNGKSQLFKGNRVAVSINPDTGMMIQVNPLKKEKIK